MALIPRLLLFVFLKNALTLSEADDKIHTRCRSVDQREAEFCEILAKILGPKNELDPETESQLKNYFKSLEELMPEKRGGFLKLLTEVRREEPEIPESKRIINRMLIMPWYKAMHYGKRSFDWVSYFKAMDKQKHAARPNKRILNWVPWYKAVNRGNKKSKRTINWVPWYKAMRASKNRDNKRILNWVPWYRNMAKEENKRTSMDREAWLEEKEDELKKSESMIRDLIWLKEYLWKNTPETSEKEKRFLSSQPWWYKHKARPVTAENVMEKRQEIVQKMIRWYNDQSMMKADSLRGIANRLYKGPHAK